MLINTKELMKQNYFKITLIEIRILDNITQYVFIYIYKLIFYINCFHVSKHGWNKYNFRSILYIVFLFSSQFNLVLENWLIG